MPQTQIRGLIRNLHATFKTYRLNPTNPRTSAWQTHFDRVFRRRTGCATLDRLLARLYANERGLNRTAPVMASSGYLFPGILPIGSLPASSVKLINVAKPATTPLLEKAHDARRRAMTPEEASWLQQFVNIKPDSRLMAFPAEAVLTVVLEKPELTKNGAAETAARLFLAVCRAAKTQAAVTERLRNPPGMPAAGLDSPSDDYIAMNTMLSVGIDALSSIGVTAGWINDVYKAADLVCRTLTVHLNPRTVADEYVGTLAVWSRSEA